MEQDVRSNNTTCRNTCLHASLQGADIVVDALSTDAAVALGIHEVTECKQNLR